MKKILFLALSVMFIISCGGSNQKASENKMAEAREFIKADIEAANELLSGEQIDFMTVYDGAEFVNDVIHYYYTIDEDYAAIDVLKAEADDIKTNLRGALESMPLTKELISQLETVGGSLTFHYKGDDSGETLSITVYDF
jgi:hypothetical protein